MLATHGSAHYPARACVDEKTGRPGSDPKAAHVSIESPVELDSDDPDARLAIRS